MKNITINIEEKIQEALIVVTSKKAITYEEFLKKEKTTSFKNKGIVYFVFENEELKYIGKSKGKYFRYRMKNHFIKKNKGTASKINEIKLAQKGGKSIKLSYLTVSPESFRSVVEDELIVLLKHKNKLWNLQKG